MLTGPVYFEATRPNFISYRGSLAKIGKAVSPDLLCLATRMFEFPILEGCRPGGEGMGGGMGSCSLCCLDGLEVYTVLQLQSCSTLLVPLARFGKQKHSSS